MSIDPVVRDFQEALRQSTVASSPGFSSLLNRAISRSDELERTSGSTTASFFRQLGRDLIRLRGSAHAPARLECLFRVSGFLWHYGEARQAEIIAKHAIELASSTNNLRELRRSYVSLGVIQADLGDVGQALQSYLQSIEVALKLNDHQGECIGWNNMAALFVNSGLYREAIVCATQCIRIAERYQSPNADWSRRAENNIVLARFRLGDCSGALESARRLAQSAHEPKTAYEAAGRIVLEEHFVLALIASKQISEARSRINYAMDLVSRFPAPRQELIVCTMRGLFEVVAGEPLVGIELLEKAVTIAQLHQPAVFVDALSALAKAYEEAGNFSKALEVTRRLICHLEAIHLETSVQTLDSLHEQLDRHFFQYSLNRAEIDKVEAQLRSKVLERDLVHTRQEMLERMAVAADIREDISGEHGYRVGCLSALLAKEIGWSRDACSALDIAARLHDIGKIGIPEKILFDKKTLQEAEKHFVASHTTVGAEILSRSEIPQVRIAEEIARYHHEWWDGTGYPKGLKEKTIPKGARIVALADAFDAMTHGRPYAKAIPIEAALEQIASLRGRQFDPELTDHFLALVRRLAASNEDLDAFLGKAGRNSPFLRARARIKEMLAQGQDSTALSSSAPPLGTPLN